MLQAFFSLYCLVKNMFHPKVFFKFFKEQDLFFISKTLLDFEEKNASKCNNLSWEWKVFGSVLLATPLSPIKPLEETLLHQ